jgi:hypothetical protein
MGQAQIVQSCSFRPCGVFGGLRSVKYAGAPTTAIRASGAILTEIIPLATASPKRMPASKRSATMSVSPTSITISTLTSGYFGKKRSSAGRRTDTEAFSVAVRWIVPARVSRNAVTAAKLGVDLLKARAHGAQQAFAGLGR